MARQTTGIFFSTATLSTVLAGTAFFSIVFTVSNGRAAPPPAAPPSAPPAAAAPAKTTPAVAPPSAQQPPAAGTGAQSTQLLFAEYNETQFQSSQAAGRAAMLVFAQSGHPVWLNQAPRLQVLMRSSERADVDIFQVDISDQALCAKYKIKTPGTLVVIKDGMERLRSTGMTRDAALKKFLRLIPTL